MYYFQTLLLIQRPPNYQCQQMAYLGSIGTRPDCQKSQKEIIKIWNTSVYCLKIDIRTLTVIGLKLLLERALGGLDPWICKSMTGILLTWLFYAEPENT